MLVPRPTERRLDPDTPTIMTDEEDWLVAFGTRGLEAFTFGARRRASVSPSPREAALATAARQVQRRALSANVAKLNWLSASAADRHWPEPPPDFTPRKLVSSRPKTQSAAKTS